MQVWRVTHVMALRNDQLHNQWLRIKPTSFRQHPLRPALQIHRVRGMNPPSSCHPIWYTHLTLVLTQTERGFAIAIIQRDKRCIVWEKKATLCNASHIVPRCLFKVFLVFYQMLIRLRYAKRGNAFSLYAMDSQLRTCMIRISVFFYPKRSIITLIISR